MKRRSSNGKENYCHRASGSCGDNTHGSLCVRSRVSLLYNSAAWDSWWNSPFVLRYSIQNIAFIFLMVIRRLHDERVSGFGAADVSPLLKLVTILSDRGWCFAGLCCWFVSLVGSCPSQQLLLLVFKRGIPGNFPFANALLPGRDWTSCGKNVCWNKLK